MKKNFLLAALCCLFVSATFAQTSPLAPKDYQSKVRNSTWLYIAIGNINIPVYLNSARNVTIQYCWYNTTLQFGNSVRTSEEPIRKEEGCYTNGRLTQYNNGSYIYRISWSSSGAITGITQYDYNGTNYQTYTLSGMYWVDHKALKSKGKGLSSSASIYISDVLLKDEYASDTVLRLWGYCISSGWLCEQIVEKSLGKVRGQLAKGWKDDSRIDRLKKINSDGSFAGNQCFDFSDDEKCAYFEN